jgi:hypothetical protein
VVPVALSSADRGGDPSPRCTTFFSFIEHAELERQKWVTAKVAGLSLSLPSVIFPQPRRGARAIELVAPEVWATDMAGRRATFSVKLSVEHESPAAILSKILRGSWELTEAGPRIAGKRGIDLQMGVEGVGQHDVAVRLGPGRTLAARVDWVDAFANQELTIPLTMQLAIADRILASVEEIGSP